MSCAALELAEKLVVEVVAVGQHHQRRVLHRRMPHHAGGEEQHGETLAAALRVPDHARAAVARLAAVHPPRPVGARALAQRCCRSAMPLARTVSSTAAFTAWN
jgi:hypothetical protein